MVHKPNASRYSSTVSWEDADSAYGRVLDSLHNDIENDRFQTNTVNTCNYSPLGPVISVLFMCIDSGGWWYGGYLFSYAIDHLYYFFHNAGGAFHVFKVSI